MFKYRLGGAIRHIGNIHKYARPEDVPENTMFVITTDGMENASHRYDSKQVKQMIERQKEKYGWEFIFVAANIDAVETARDFGIDENRLYDNKRPIFVKKTKVCLIAITFKNKVYNY